LRGPINSRHLYRNKYILSFDNDLNENYEIQFNFKDYSGETWRLFGTEDCLTIRSTSGDENKFEPILGREALINIAVGPVTENGIRWSNDDLVIDDLVAEHDSDILVSVYKDQDYARPVFQGFIVVEDNSQPFLDPPFTLSIRALDGLGLLKGVDLLDTEGNVFSAPLTPIGWISQILYKTAIPLHIRVYFDFVNTTFPDIDPINHFMIPATTFQQGQLQPASTDPTVDIAASEVDDCYTALEKIVRCLGCRLFQEDGYWHLVSVYTHCIQTPVQYQEYQMTDPVSGIVGYGITARVSYPSYDIPVGPAGEYTIHPVQDDAMRYIKLATKSFKLSFAYDQSLNKVENQTLTQLGNSEPANDELINEETIDASLDQNNTNNFQFKTFAYDFFGWKTYQSPRQQPYLFPLQANPRKFFIRVVHDLLDYENERFAVLENSGSSQHQTIAVPSTFLIDSGDVLQLSINWRMRNADPGEIPPITMSVILKGDDGSFWALRVSATISGSGGVPSAWDWRSFPDPNTGDGAVPIFGPALVPDGGYTSWSTLSANDIATAPAKAPVSGVVQVYIWGKNYADTNELWFKDFSVTVIPYLQGSYSVIKGDYNLAISNNNIKQAFSAAVEISDSPKRYFKGALLQNDGKSLMPTTWVRQDSPGDKPARFAALMAKLRYNQLYRQNEKIEGTFRGLTYIDPSNIGQPRHAGFLNNYLFVNHPVPSKKFMLTSYEIDYAKGSGRRVFVECLKDFNDTGWVEPNQTPFQYLFN
jgi:hypothetical protein